jgi:predicted methyltransferase
MLRFASLVSIALLLGACTKAEPTKSPDQAALIEPTPPTAEPARMGETTRDPAAYRAIVEAPDRDAADKALDAGRHPAELLAFFGIRPGWRVAEVGAAGGYTSELLARAVAPDGIVYGQNSPAVLQRFAEKPWSERLAKPVMKGVVRVDREFDSPLPPEVKNLDAVLNIMFYHDTVWQGVDREAMNKAVYAALKPGGIYGIVDHSAQPGAALAHTETLHRIDEKTLRAEIESAGFRLVDEGKFLKNPADTRDWSTSPRVVGEKRGTSDRFVLRFEKPDVTGK